MQDSGRSEAPHLPDATPAHLLHCVSCRAYFRSTLEPPDGLDGLFGSAETMLTCLRPEEIEAYRQGRCSALERESIEMHLADCAACLRKVLPEALLSS